MPQAIHAQIGRTPDFSFFSQHPTIAPTKARKHAPKTLESTPSNPPISTTTLGEKEPSIAIAAIKEISKEVAPDNQIGSERPDSSLESRASPTAPNAMSEERSPISIASKRYQSSVLKSNTWWSCDNIIKVGGVVARLTLANCGEHLVKII
jgi:hypothetical protein